MSITLFLNPNTWDLELDSNGNIAVATDTYQQAQDISTACRTFLGEVYFDQSIGIPYLENIFGNQGFPLSLYKMHVEDAAVSVMGVESASASLLLDSRRQVSGVISFSNSDGEATAISL